MLSLPARANVAHVSVFHVQEAGDAVADVVSEEQRLLYVAVTRSRAGLVPL